MFPAASLRRSTTPAYLEIERGQGWELLSSINARGRWQRAPVRLPFHHAKCLGPGLCLDCIHQRLFVVGTSPPPLARWSAGRAREQRWCLFRLGGSKHAGTCSVSSKLRRVWLTLLFVLSCIAFRLSIFCRMSCPRSCTQLSSRWTSHTTGRKSDQLLCNVNHVNHARLCTASAPPLLAAGAAPAARLTRLKFSCRVPLAFLQLRRSLCQSLFNRLSFCISTSFDISATCQQALTGYVELGRGFSDLGR
eukprot:SAG11_NODE_153_length_14352_cov_24.348323_2_plen_249_part_00